jgi:hypothetical protein
MRRGFTFGGSRARRSSASPAELDSALDGALAVYRAGDSLMVCAALPCAGAFGFDTSDQAAAEIASHVAMPVVRTGCQGHCKHKPVVSLRVGERREMFGQLATNHDRRAMFDYAKAAHALGSFVVPDSNVDALRFDLEHGSFEPAARLGHIQFLSGRFRGEGQYADGAYKFVKEMVELRGRGKVHDVEDGGALPDERRSPRSSSGARGRRVGLGVQRQAGGPGLHRRRRHARLRGRVPGCVPGVRRPVSRALSSFSGDCAVAYLVAAAKASSTR